MHVSRSVGRGRSIFRTVLATIAGDCPCIALAARCVPPSATSFEGAWHTTRGRSSFRAYSCLL
eukprot:5191241-Amphidinium_carterae.1